MLRQQCHLAADAFVQPIAVLQTCSAATDALVASAITVASTAP
jgi:hypothetical protein